MLLLLLVSVLYRFVRLFFAWLGVNLQGGSRAGLLLIADLGKSVGLNNSVLKIDKTTNCKNNYRNLYQTM